MGSQHGGQACSTLSRVAEHFSDDPVHHGGEECSGRFPEPSSSVPGLRMDLGLGSGERVTDQVASDGRSLLHLFQLLSASVFFSAQRSHCSRDRCLSSELGRPAMITCQIKANSGKE